MRLRHSVFPRLAGFLLTTDVISLTEDDQATDEDHPNTVVALGHPPPLRQPAALYYLPAKLTPAQERFLAKQKRLTERTVAEEMAEWAVDRKKGVDEVAELRKKAEDNDVAETPANDEPPHLRSASVAAVGESKMEVESAKVGDDDISPVDPNETAAAQKSAIDTEDTIEY